MITISQGSPFPSSPQGRLTLTSGAAVPTTDVATATTVYYTPAVGKYVPLWNGSALLMTDTGGELSQATTDTTKSPAAVTTNSNYDVFVWNDSGTIRATRGPAWTSDTARGTGAGTTELDFTTAPGVPLNKNAITNGPIAGAGTYVGTIRSDGSSTINMVFGGSAVGGGMATLGVWNLYNRVQSKTLVVDSTNTWTYASTTVRPMNNSTTNRINFVTGLAIDPVWAKHLIQVNTAAVANCGAVLGLTLDSSTTTFDYATTIVVAPTANIFKVQQPAIGIWPQQIGFHYLSGVESCLDNINTITFSSNGFPFRGIQSYLWG